MTLSSLRLHSSLLSAHDFSFPLFQSLLFSFVRFLLRLAVYSALGFSSQLELWALSVHKCYSLMQPSYQPFVISFFFEAVKEAIFGCGVGVAGDRFLIEVLFFRVVCHLLAVV